MACVVKTRSRVPTCSRSTSPVLRRARQPHQRPRQRLRRRRHPHNAVNHFGNVKRHWQLFGAVRQRVDHSQKIHQRRNIRDLVQNTDRRIDNFIERSQNSNQK